MERQVRQGASPDSPFAARTALGGDAPTLARRLLAMSHDDFVEAFRGSAMKRTKLPKLKRNAAVVLGNAGGADDVERLAQARDSAEPLVREHAEWALEQLQQ
ncbi:MAG: hypothetical protein IPF47_15930 [Gemmatimonadetes bacterium]|nr:hypothetical protein [Gemmatimonadota bacterium]